MLKLFKFLKRKQQVINLDNAEEWIKERSNINDIRTTLGEIESLKSDIKEGLELLENIKLDTKIDNNIISRVKGNIPSYANALNFFLEHLKIPADIGPKDINSFIIDMENGLELLNKKTYKNYYIISSIVGKELETITKSLKGLTKHTGILKKQTEHLEKTDRIIQKIRVLREYLSAEEERKKKIGLLIKEKEDVSNENLELEREIKLLKLNPRYNRLDIDRKKLEDTKAMIGMLENEFTDLFSTFSKGLKKYNNICTIKLVSSYLENPISALVNDSDMEILKYLGETSDMFRQDKIPIRDDKKDRILKGIAKMNAAYISSFLKKRSNLLSGQQDIIKKINENKIEQEIRLLEDNVLRNKSRLLDVEKAIASFRELDVASELNNISLMLREIGEDVGLECSGPKSIDLKH